MTVRPRQADDDAAIAELIREVAPAWVASDAGVGHRLRATPVRARRADWVAAAGGAVVGWGSGGLETDIDRRDVGWLHVMVCPAHRREGIGAALYDAADAHLREVGARRLLSQGANDECSRAFAERRGFRHSMTRALSSLDPRTVDPGELAELAAAKEAEGFVLAPFSAFAERPEVLYVVDAEASLDEPNDEQITDLRLEDWLERSWRDPDLALEGSFAVLHDGRPVAITEVIVDLPGRRAANGFTGTLRAYRGRGLARLAKLASIAWLREQGVDRLVTTNDETNAAMLAVNRRLGYAPFATQLSWVKDGS
jgi:GNAT superfamily N-acetyltransferase